MASHSEADKLIKEIVGLLPAGGEDWSEEEGGDEERREEKRGEDVKRPETLTYKFNLPAIWEIHPILSVAMLEQAPNGTEPLRTASNSGKWY